MVLIVPLASAYAESFTVTTNKDIYTIGEKAIIVGVVPGDAPEGYAILIRVAGPGGEDCSVQNILPESDNSFVSRPVNLANCGTGQYTVFAYYAEASTNSTFTVSDTSKTLVGNKMEMRLLKIVVLKAQESVNQKLKEFLDANGALPEDIVDNYNQGVLEASKALQAIEFGNVADAKKNMGLSIGHLREVIESLSAERIVHDLAADLPEDDENSKDSLLGRYERLKEFYFRLEELAQKNGVDRETEFGTIVSLLARSKQLIDEGELEGAGGDLSRANEMLEAIRQILFEEGNAAASASDNSTQPDDVEARRLIAAADRFEKKAYNLLNESDSDNVDSKIQEALALISSARLSINDGSYESARAELSAAFTMLEEAKDMMSKGSCSEGSDEGSDGDGRGDDDNDDSGSGKGNKQ
ncbi:MAG: hypothetical protein ACREAQ_09435 [Nitrososphaera sp.]